MLVPLAAIGPACYPTTNLDPDPNGTAVDAAVMRAVMVRKSREVVCEGISHSELTGREHPRDDEPLAGGVAWGFGLALASAWAP
jgi:hypothetical protein